MNDFVRMAWVNRLRPEHADQYCALHADAWPDVLQMITHCNIRNYSIFHREAEGLLFGYFEYYGGDYDADMARMANHPKTREWWALTDPCQKPLDSLVEGENWAPMTEIFYHD